MIRSPGFTPAKRMWDDQFLPLTQRFPARSQQ